jgi:RimJ/RimL family protein N-acetyltransferase
MVPRAHGELAEVAGGVERLRSWFVAFWPDDPATGAQEWGHYLSGQYVCLREVTPVRIRQKTERVAQAAEALDLLRRDPHDPTGRGMLGEAVDGVLGVPGLDSLLLPMTAYDRLRFGGPTVRERWVDGPRAEFLTPVPPVWPLRTERLVLRPHEPRDAEAYVEAWASEEWTSLLLTRTLNRAEVAEMVRRRMDPGDGRFVGLVVEHDGEVVGDSMLHLQGTGLSEGEIGWTVLPQHAGRGFATEAAQAVLRLAFEHYGLRRVVANLDARNERSAALCERLGMRREVDRVADFWSKGTWTSSYEYALLRDEGRAAQA